ncbi:MAG: HAD family phosphatase [Acidimicrobiia bacterium]|nr:HAD family phosphatase [Acidimicrobiia bacterium]
MADRRPIVFDLDGVLIDSEDLAWEAWRRVLAGYAIALTDTDIAELTGRTEHEAHAHFANRGRLPEFSEFWKDIAEATYALFDERLEAYDDAIDALEFLLRRGHRIALASSSPRERVDRSLGAVGLAGRFHFVVAGDEVGVGKPDPEIFRTAAAGLGVDAGACVAVEDAPSGIQAAKAAGMRVVAVERGLFPRHDLLEADVVVPRLIPAVFLE